jgi:LysM repeat protein
MPDEMKQEMVTYGNKLVNKPKWSATNASVDAGATTYKVQAGNTLGQIVADYNKKNGTALKWQDVAKWNSIDPSKMKIGQVINFADPTAQIVDQNLGQPVDNNTEQNILLPGGNTKPSVDSLGVKSPTDSTGLTAVDSLAAKNGPAAPQLDSAAIAAAIDSADVKIANILKAAGTPSEKTRPSFDLASMMANRGWKPSTIQIPKFQYSTFNKQGGTMNRINYFQ